MIKNPTAFPVSHYVNSDGETFMSEPTGMTLRDWFAGQTICGLVTDWTSQSPQSLASVAYQMADALLIARTHEPEESQ